MSTYGTDAAISLAMYADTNELTYEAGLRLAQEVADEVEQAALERRDIPGIRFEGEPDA